MWKYLFIYICVTLVESLAKSIYSNSYVRKLWKGHPNFASSYIESHEKSTYDVIRNIIREIIMDSRVGSKWFI